MAMRFVLTDYVSQALAQAIYDKLEDATFALGSASVAPVILAQAHLLRVAH